MPTTLNATTTSSSVAAAEFNRPMQIVANDGPADVRVRVGATGLTALVTDALVKAGSIVAFGTNLGTAAFIAAIVPPGQAAGTTAALRISSPGAGAQYNAGPTGAQG